MRLVRHLIMSIAILTKNKSTKYTFQWDTSIDNVQVLHILLPQLDEQSNESLQ